MSAEFRPLFDPASQTLKAESPLFSPMTAPRPDPSEKAEAPCGDPKVELKRDGDRITQIRVHCRCGEVVELACEY